MQTIQHTNNRNWVMLGKPQFEKGRVYLGIAQMGGGSRPLPKWFGALIFEKNCPCSKGHLLGLGGLNPCQDGLGHLCSENWSSNGICSSRSGNKVPQSARLSEGVGVQSLFGQCPNRPCVFFSGASLRDLFDLLGPCCVPFFSFLGKFMQRMSFQSASIQLWQKLVLLTADL